MKRFMSKKVAAIGLAAGITLGLGGAAFAYFTTTGNSTGTATTGSATAWKVSVASSTATDLVPVKVLGTGPIDYIPISVTNASPGTQLLNEVDVYIKSIAAVHAGPNLCTAADFSVDGQAVGVTATYTSLGLDELGTTDAGGPGVWTDPTHSGSASLQLVDNGLNQDQCQGATVTLEADAS